MEAEALRASRLRKNLLGAEPKASTAVALWGKKKRRKKREEKKQEGIKKKVPS